MTGYLLDTNICIHFMKGEFGLREKIQEIGFDRCYISEITIAELLYGVAKGSGEMRADNLRRINSLRYSFSERTINITASLEEFAEQKAYLRGIGRIVADLDIFLGASAIANNLVLATRNTKDFVNMKGIELQNWIDAE